MVSVWCLGFIMWINGDQWGWGAINCDWWLLLMWNCRKWWLENRNRLKVAHYWIKAGSTSVYGGTPSARQVTKHIQSPRSPHASATSSLLVTCQTYLLDSQVRLFNSATLRLHHHISAPYPAARHRHCSSLFCSSFFFAKSFTVYCTVQYKDLNFWHFVQNRWKKKKPQGKARLVGRASTKIGKRQYKIFAHICQKNQNHARCKQVRWFP
jgi:hypothetical protein